MTDSSSYQFGSDRVWFGFGWAPELEKGEIMVMELANQRAKLEAMSCEL